MRPPIQLTSLPISPSTPINTSVTTTTDLRDMAFAYSLFADHPSAAAAARSTMAPAMASKLRHLAGQSAKPDLRILLSTTNKTYTTLDRIEGVVHLTAPVDTPFDGLDIEFAGSVRTYVERLTTSPAASGRSEAFHQFLKLVQPGLPALFPADNVLRAGRTYDFPFVFAVPQQLLPRVCRHPVSADAVRDAHLRLPPTFGDRALQQGPAALDDLAPDMASVRYGVFVKLSALRTKGDETWQATLAAKARRVRVIPAVEEQPPLHAERDDDEYVLRKEKTIRRNVLAGKAGTLVVEAPQPRAFQVRSYANPDARVDTVAQIALRYDPADERSPPPRLAALSSKLKVTTFFGATARRVFPRKAAAFVDMSQGMHSETLPLSSRSMAGVEWTRHVPGDDDDDDDDGDPAARGPPTIDRRDSATSVFSRDVPPAPTPSANYKGKAYYTAYIVVPVTLPPHRAFPPTFHSCLVSRVYALKLDLNLAKGAALSSLDLRVPVQIASEGLVGDEFARSGSVDHSVETDIDGEDVSAFFEARLIRTPATAYLGRSRIGSQAPVEDAPPSYFAQQTPPGGPEEGDEREGAEGGGESNAAPPPPTTADADADYRPRTVSVSVPVY